MTQTASQQRALLADYAVSEGGALLTGSANASYRAAVCSEVVMSSGKSCAEVTVLRRNKGTRRRWT